MAAKAERTQILKIALSAAFDYRDLVIGVPQTLSCDPHQPPIGKQFLTLGSTRSPQFAIRRDGVGPADGANTGIAQQNLFANVPGISAQTPFIHAPIRTEREAPCWNFQAAPAA
jgi:hypothetical protein